MTIVIVWLNILFGIIIDTFAELRDTKQKVEEDTKKRCFICGIEAYTFDRFVEGGFVRHTKGPHNMWMYLYFMHHLKLKDGTEFNGQESYVYQKMVQKDMSFFPLHKSLDLVSCVRGGDGLAEDGDAAPTDLDNAALQMDPPVMVTDHSAQLVQRAVERLGHGIKGDIAEELRAVREQVTSGLRALRGDVQQDLQQQIGAVRAEMLYTLRSVAQPEGLPGAEHRFNAENRFQSPPHHANKTPKNRSVSEATCSTLLCGSGPRHRRAPSGNILVDVPMIETTPGTIDAPFFAHGDGPAADRPGAATVKADSAKADTVKCPDDALLDLCRVTTQPCLERAEAHHQLCNGIQLSPPTVVPSKLRRFPSTVKAEPLPVTLSDLRAMHPLGACSERTVEAPGGGPEAMAVHASGRVSPPTVAAPKLRRFPSTIKAEPLPVTVSELRAARTPTPPPGPAVEAPGSGPETVDAGPRDDARRSPGSAAEAVGTPRAAPPAGVVLLHCPRYEGAASPGNATAVPRRSPGMGSPRGPAVRTVTGMVLLHSPRREGEASPGGAFAVPLGEEEHSPPRRPSKSRSPRGSEGTGIEILEEQIERLRKKVPTPMRD